MSNEWIDQPGRARAGEELDTGRLEAYLSEALPEVGGPLVIEQFPGGHSNLTYLLRAGEQELVLRRPPIGVKIKSAHDMGREYRILSRLGEVYAKVPRALLYCEDEAVIGAPLAVVFGAVACALLVVVVGITQSELRDPNLGSSINT